MENIEFVFFGICLDICNHYYVFIYIYCILFNYFLCSNIFLFDKSQPNKKKNRSHH